MALYDNEWVICTGVGFLVMFLILILNYLDTKLLPNQIGYMIVIIVVLARGLTEYSKKAS